MKIRDINDWKCLKFQLKSFGFNKKQLEIVEELWEGRQLSIKETILSFRESIAFSPKTREIDTFMTKKLVRNTITYLEKKFNLKSGE